MQQKYYLKGDWESVYTEVTKEVYIKAEREAGFRSKFGDKEIATAGFSAHGISGKVKYQ